MSSFSFDFFLVFFFQLASQKKNVRLKKKCCFLTGLHTRTLEKRNHEKKNTGLHKSFFVSHSISHMKKKKLAWKNFFRSTPHMTKQLCFVSFCHRVLLEFFSLRDTHLLDFPKCIKNKFHLVSHMKKKYKITQLKKKVNK